MGKSKLFRTFDVSSKKDEGRDSGMGGGEYTPTCFIFFYKDYIYWHEKNPHHIGNTHISNHRWGIIVDSFIGPLVIWWCQILSLPLYFI